MRGFDGVVLWEENLNGLELPLHEPRSAWSNFKHWLHKIGDDLKESFKQKGEEFKQNLQEAFQRAVIDALIERANEIATELSKEGGSLDKALSSYLHSVPSSAAPGVRILLEKLKSLYEEAKKYKTHSYGIFIALTRCVLMLYQKLDHWGVQTGDEKRAEITFINDAIDHMNSLFKDHDHNREGWWYLIRFTSKRIGGIENKSTTISIPGPGPGYRPGHLLSTTDNDSSLPSRPSRIERIITTYRYGYVFVHKNGYRQYIQRSGNAAWEEIQALRLTSSDTLIDELKRDVIDPSAKLAKTWVQRRAALGGSGSVFECAFKYSTGVSVLKMLPSEDSTEEERSPEKTAAMSEKGVSMLRVAVTVGMLRLEDLAVLGTAVPRL